MHTNHRVIDGDARDLEAVSDRSAHLVVTSPPYPLVAMWDPAFRAMSPTAAAALDQDDGSTAFDAMHAELDRVWAACHRVLVDGGIACINIGDATRTIDGRFSLWPNHARILSAARRLGFTILPDILWRKPTNAPNKFMGSGMLPAGAYVTYEHEYVLVLRKPGRDGGGRAFSSADKERRRRSAYFWEERNSWFSDVWSDVRGTRQELDRSARERSGAFPIELPYRLICMYSLQEDVVLDPFAGTGTTSLAAAMAARNSVAVEHEPDLVRLARARLSQAPSLGAERVALRLDDHRAFVQQRQQAGKPLKHHNDPHDMPVITRQERALQLLTPHSVEPGPEGATCRHGAPVASAQGTLTFA